MRVMFLHIQDNETEALSFQKMCIKQFIDYYCEIQSVRCPKVLPSSHFVCNVSTIASKTTELNN